MVLILRRLPGILYNHVYSIVISSAVMIFFIYMLFHWRFFCTNFEPQQHVRKLCNQYEKNEVVGDLCLPLCVTSTIHSVSCHAFHAGKEIVFSAMRADKSRLVFKLARHGESNRFDNLDDYPTELEFESMIMDHVRSRLNVSLTQQQVRGLARFTSGEHAAEDSAERMTEMRAIWHLLQDNEYLVATVFLDKDVFPKVIGSCGPYFAVEYLLPSMEGAASKGLSEEGGRESWANRVHLAVMILDLLSDLDVSVPGGISLCDIKPEHFGLSQRSGKLKFLDLDVVLPKARANTIILSGSPCRIHADCDLFDCKSQCNTDTGKCEGGIINDNLQVVCEKIFLGWQISGRLIMPGLLMSQHTPTQLASLLRQCAEPDIDEGSPHSVQERLSATLSEIDRILAAPSYDYYDHKL